MPDAASFLFAQEVAITRDIAWQRRILTSSLGNQDWGTVGSFFQEPAHADSNYFRISVRDRNDGAAQLSTDRSLRPKGDARVEVHVRIDDVDNTAADPNPKDVLKFVGNMVEDSHFGEGFITIVAELMNSPQLGLASMYPDFDFQAGVDFTRINLKLLEDVTPFDRYSAALKILKQAASTDSAACSGVDTLRAVTRSPQTVTNLGVLAAQVLHPADDDVSDHAKYMRRLRQDLGQIFKPLNRSQCDAAWNSIDSICGLTVAQGPPGTGKSVYLATVAVAHVMVGKMLGKKRPIILCAPSNVAVDGIVDKLDEAIGRNPNIPAVNVMRFTSDLARPPKVKRTPRVDAHGDDKMEDDKPADAQKDPLPDTDEGRAEAERLQREEELAEHQAQLFRIAAQGAHFAKTQRHTAKGFYKLREAFITRLEGSADGTMHKTQAVRYRRTKDQLEASRKRKGKAAREKTKELRSELEGLEHAMNETFFEQEVDIVCCTMSTAMHQILLDYFKPVIAGLDEVAICTVPDAATPLAAFITTIQHIIMVGDHEQQQPVVTSRKYNEMADILGTSMFRACWTSDLYENYKFTFTIQHRMNPGISDVPKEIFYPNVGLTDADHIRDFVDPKWLTLEAMMRESMGSHAFPAGRRRFFIDVSGPVAFQDVDIAEARSERPDNGPSFFNLAEAELIVAFVYLALRMGPPEGGEKIEPIDFLIVTPYAGQVSLIKDLLRAKEIPFGTTESGRGVQVYNSRAVQGSEGRFVLFSLTRRTPARPNELGFVGDQYAINVAFSRPQQAMIVFGNWIAVSNKATSGLWGDMAGKVGEKYFHLGKVITKGRNNGEIIHLHNFLPIVSGEAPPEVRLIDGALDMVQRSSRQPQQSPDTIIAGHNLSHFMGRGARGGARGGQGRGAVHRPAGRPLAADTGIAGVGRGAPRGGARGGAPRGGAGTWPGRFQPDGRPAPRGGAGRGGRGG
jgi:superfamily I DNA and/or RNA helicase